MDSRIQDHKRDKVFDKIYLLEYSNFSETCYYENFLILHFLPKLNKYSVSEKYMKTKLKKCIVNYERQKYS